jgi:hypothetical protein
MAFTSVHKNGGGGGVTITPRALLRVDRPLSVNSSGSAAASGNGHKPVVAATPAGSPSVRPKSASPSSTAYHRRSSSGSAGKNGFETAVPNRVRVAVRLRPRNAEELVSDVDFADCVELQPEVCCAYSPWILATLLLHQTSTKFECQFPSKILLP